MSLTGKQQAFVEAYLGEARFNATRAAEMAGYGGEEGTLAVIGCENLRKPKIAQRIRQRLRESAMTADEVLMRLSEQARGEQGRYIKVDGLLNVEALITDGKGHLIKKIKEQSGGGLEIEFYDAQRALQLLGQVHGLFRERSEAFNIDVSKLNDEQLERIANGEDPIYVLATSGTGEGGAGKAATQE